MPKKSSKFFEKRGKAPPRYVAMLENCGKSCDRVFSAIMSGGSEPDKRFLGWLSKDHTRAAYHAVRTACLSPYMEKECTEIHRRLYRQLLLKTSGTLKMLENVTNDDADADYRNAVVTKIADMYKYMDDCYVKKINENKELCERHIDKLGVTTILPTLEMVKVLWDQEAATRRAVALKKKLKEPQSD